MMLKLGQLSIRKNPQRILSTIDLFKPISSCFQTCIGVKYIWMNGILVNSNLSLGSDPNSNSFRDDTLQNVLTVEDSFNLLCMGF